MPEVDEMKMPRFNANTVVIIATMAFGWGANYIALHSSVTQNADKISEIKSALGTLQTAAQAYQNVTFRIGRLEDGFLGLTTETRDQERTMSTIASDIRVMREIVERLDKANSK
jgi:hypothetical protein